MPVFQIRQGMVLRKIKRVLFIHIPKTGGTSIEDTFAASGWHVDLLDRGSRGFSMLPYLRCSPQHMHWELLRQILDMTAIDLVFTIVRNPVDRILSEYRWRAQFLGVRSSADEWICTTLESYASDPFIYDNHIRPQHQFIPPGASIYRYEDGLSAALDAVARVMDVSFSDIPHLQRTRPVRKRSQRALSRSTFELINRFYAEDIEALGYSS